MVLEVVAEVDVTSSAATVAVESAKLDFLQLVTDVRCFRRVLARGFNYIAICVTK